MITIQYEYFNYEYDTKDLEYSIKYKIIEINGKPFRRMNYIKMTGINSSSPMAMMMSQWGNDDN
tara:strand:+ start:918 stop:1109 length:192 start_codon:yes stop_codon:yes gene_type:complete